MRISLAVAALCLFLPSISGALAQSTPPAGDDSAQQERARWEASGDLADGAALVEKLNRSSRHQEAIELAETLRGRSGVTPDLQARLLAAVAFSSLNLRQFDRADSLIAEAERLAPRVDKLSSMYGVWGNVGAIRYNQSQFAAAEALFQRSLEAADPAVPSQMMRALMNRSVMQLKQGRYAQAIEGLLEALKVAESAGETRQISSLYQNLGSLYLEMGNWERAAAFTRRAIESNLEGPRNESVLQANLGAVLLTAGDEAGALDAFQRSLQIAQEQGIDAAGAASNMGVLLQKRGRYSEAMEHFQMAAAVYEKNQNLEHLAITRKNLGETTMLLGDGEKAADYLQQSYELSREHGSRPKQLELYPVMIDNLAALGREAEALKLMREYKSLSDDTINVASNERIAQLESAFDLATRERELAASERDRALQQEKLTQLQARQQAQELQSSIALADKERALSILERDRAVQQAALIELQAKERTQRMETALDLATKQQAIVALQARQRGLRTATAGLVGGVALLGVIALLLVRSVRYRSRTNLALSQLNQQLDHLSKHDELTGLPNRRFLATLLPGEVESIRASFASGRPHRNVIFLVDVDEFKEINDRWGHPAGDQVLSHFAQVLKRCARENDVLVRWGGDEFLWLCRGAGHDDGAELADRLQQSLAATPIMVDEGPITARCSIGFAPFPLTDDPDGDWDRSLKMADSALYEAKEGGGWTGIGFDRPANNHL